MTKYYKKELQKASTLWILSSDVHGPIGAIEHSLRN